MPLFKPIRAAQVNESHPLARGLVGCWLFNEGVGGKVFDLSSKKYTGTLYGNTSWMPGKYGSCLDFDGSGDYVSLGSGVFQEVDNSPITVTAQIKAPVQSAVYGGILDHAQGSGPKGFGLALGNDGRLCFYNSGTQTWHTWLPTLDLDNQQWHFVAVTLDQSGNLIFYADGEKSSPIISSLFNVSTAGAYIGARYWYSIDGYFTGRIDHVMLFNRALTAAEIAFLYREPFCVFDLPIEPGLLYPAGQIVWLTAASTATASVYGSLTKQSKLAGIIDVATALSGILTWRYRGQVERQWLIEALFNAMTANAFKLATVLTGGWFWMRRFGCSALYRGPSMEQIDFANILTVAEQDAGSISPPDYIPHHSNSTYFYVVRQFNICGYQERTLAAAVKVAIDADGNLIKPKPNNIFAWRLDQVYGNKIQLIWFYCPLEQESKPESFRIYYDGGTGLVDYQNPIATISYQGRKFYTYQSEALTAGRYLFAIRAEDAAGIENNSLAQLPIQLATQSPDSIEILSVENI